MENITEKSELVVHNKKIYRDTSLEKMTDHEFWEEIKKKGWIKLDIGIYGALGLGIGEWCFFDPNCVEGNCLFIAIAEALLFADYKKSKLNTDIIAPYTSWSIRNLLCQSIEKDEHFFKELIDHYKLLSIVEDITWDPTNVTTKTQMFEIIKDPELFNGDEFVLRSLSKILKIDFTLYDMEIIKSYVIGDNKGEHSIKLLYGFSDFKLIGKYTDQMITTVF